MDYMTKQFNAYFLHYMQADKKTRKQCRAHWEDAYALNVKNGLKDAAERAAGYLQVIRLADKILTGKC